MKIKLIKSIILVLLAIIICIPSNVYALDDLINNADKFLEAQDSNLKTINKTSLKSTSDWIYNTLFIIAIVLAIIVGTIIGIQFVTGSVEQQAKVKETLVPYIVGVFIVFASFTIWKIAIKIGEDIAPNPTVKTSINSEYKIKVALN